MKLENCNSKFEFQTYCLWFPFLSRANNDEAETLKTLWKTDECLTSVMNFFSERNSSKLWFLIFKLRFLKWRKINNIFFLDCDNFLLNSFRNDSTLNSYPEVWFDIHIDRYFWMPESFPLLLEIISCKSKIHQFRFVCFSL